MKTILRVTLAVAGGNALGYAAFRLAAGLTPHWWAAAGTPLPFGQLMLMIAFTAIAFAAPPVIVGALAAKVAAAYEPFVGLAAALWAVSARQWWPAVPLLPPQSWIAPMTLILLSGLMGGWLMGWRVPPPPQPASGEAGSVGGDRSD